MSQERERQVLFLSDETNTSPRVILGLSDGVDAQVRQLGALKVAPESLDRVEIGRVGRYLLDDQPRTLRVEERVYLSAANWVSRPRSW